MEVEERVIPEWHEFVEDAKDLVDTSSGVKMRILQPLGE
jgi:hypothetical protein